MNVLHLDEQRGWRGGEQQVAYLIQGQIAAGFRVHLAARPGSALLQRLGKDPVRPVPLRFRGEADLLAALRLARVVRREGIALLHAHTSHAHALACLARRFAPNARVIVSRRVDIPPRPGWFNRLKYHAPDHYIAISKAIDARLAAYGIPGERRTLVYSAIDPLRLQVDPLPRAALGIPGGAFLIGNVAALSPHKDHLTLLEAFAKVAVAHPAAWLVIAGDGPLRKRLEDRAAALGAADRVRFLGFREDIPQLLRALDAFVLSSTQEGLGTSILDAMAAGVPVAATASGGIPEMVRDGETGRLVPPGAPQALADALASFIEAPDQAQTLAARARAMVEESFSVGAMVEGNLAVYRQVLDRGA